MQESRYSPLNAAELIFQRRHTASVDFALSNAFDDAGNDYSGATGGSIDWADGDAHPKRIEFAIIDNGQGETEEFFDPSLTASHRAMLGAKTAVRVNIPDGPGVNHAPCAVTGVSLSVQSGGLVTLDGSASNDPDGDTLDYLWTQTPGPANAISNATLATASFTTPTVSANTLLQSRLRVADPGGRSDTATFDVTVPPQSTNIASRGGGGGDAFGAWLCLVLAGVRRLRSRLTRRDAA